MPDVYKDSEKKRIVKYIRSNSRIERYQADTIELNSRITHNHVYPYLLTIVDHFSKYMSLHMQSQTKNRKK